MFLKKQITKLLKIGENIEIEIDNDNSFLTMKSSVIQVINENRVAITMPIYKGRIYPLSIGTTLNVVFNKKDLGRFYFVGEIINRIQKGNLKILFVKKISDINHFQRRDFFRLSIVLNIDIELIENGVPTKTISGITKDISGGGLRIITKEKLEKGASVKCKITLDGELVEPYGRVLRCEPMPDSIIRYDVGFSFTTIDESIRSKIISFIFKNQRNLRKKGLI